MSTPLKRLRWALVLCATAVMAGLALASHGWGGIVQAQTVATATPVPPTPVPPGPTYLPPGPTYVVGTIELCAVEPPEAAWVEVQWQDGLGGWHNVPTWPGLLVPLVPPDQPGDVCTIRWVVPDDFGKGPFRWVVYSDEGGGIWGISDPFYFPTYAGQWVMSEASEVPAASVPIGGTLLVSAPGRPCTGGHVVRAGEDVFRIAYNCGLTTAQLAAANRLHFPYIIYPGQVLRYP